MSKLPTKKEQYELAKKLFEKQEYIEAIKLLKLCAINSIEQKGNSDAQNLLGDIYEGGYGLEQNYKIALYYYLMAVNNNNNPTALNNIGLMYKNGFGVSKDDEIAIDFFSLSVEKGNNLANFNISITYENQYINSDYRNRYTTIGRLNVSKAKQHLNKALNTNVKQDIQPELKKE